MYKIPNDEEIARAIKKVLSKHKEVRSQALFHDFVLRELRIKSPYYRVSSERIRRIASEIGVKIIVDKRKSHIDAKTCFVCGGVLATMKTKNLEGVEVPAGKRCKTCDFKMDRANLYPKRYIFYK